MMRHSMEIFENIHTLSNINKTVRRLNENFSSVDIRITVVCKTQGRLSTFMLEQSRFDKIWSE